MLPLGNASPTGAGVMEVAQFVGVCGCLLWFMFRSEPRLRAIEHAIDRTARSMIVLSIAIANVLEAMQWHGAKSIKVQADPIQKELDESESKRSND